MKLFSNEHLLDHSWEDVTIANWKKYPSEVTPHVIHVDYLSRHFDAEHGILHTERLLTCRQSVPPFILRMFGMDPVAYVYEKSEVNIRDKTLVLQGKNLSGSEIITIEETCVYRPTAKLSTDTSKDQTLFTQSVQMTSFGWPSWMLDRLEEFCLERFHLNAQKGRMALESQIKNADSASFTARIE